jgi:hypothetical protein
LVATRLPAPVRTVPSGGTQARNGLTADQSAAFLASKIRQKEPFFFLRYGDGALECIRGDPGMTCDGEDYSRELGAELLAAWRITCGAPTVYIGDWLSASFDRKTAATRYTVEYAELIGDTKPNWLHFEALLLMRESNTLLNFYRAVRDDSRKKLFMGHPLNAGAAELLGAEFLEAPAAHLFERRAELFDELLRRDFDILLYGAGMAGNIPAIRCWERYPDRTYIALGSALDPLFRGRTRSQQLLPGRAETMFARL